MPLGSSALTSDRPRRGPYKPWYGVAAACLVIASVIVVWGISRVSGSGSGSTEGPPSVSGTATSTAASAPSTVSQPATTESFPASWQPVGPGEITGFRAEHDGRSFIDAAASGVATYGMSSSCDVPDYPCYVPPSLSQVARMDVGAVPSVPGSNTCYITGHSNWRSPNDPEVGVFSALQTTQVGDTYVITTTKGVFTYSVTRTISSLPFDQLRSNVDIKTVRPYTCVVISCHIDGRGYSGNFVAFATLTASKPNES